MGAIWLLAALGLLLAARFCVRPARTHRAWWVALVATELGHVWAVVSLGVAGGAAWTASDYRGRLPDALARLNRDQAGFWPAEATGLSLCVGAGFLALVAAGLFARPAGSAWRMRGRVAAELAGVFGGEEVKEGERLWSWSRLWRWPNAGRLGPVETFADTGAGGLPVDFYRARGLAQGGKTVCVLVVHGGGWDSGDRSQLAAFNHWLAEHGVAVVAVSYRLAPAHRWPAQRDDVRAAVAWVRANAERLGVDADRLVLLGRSAGAQIVAATAYGETVPGLRAVVALYGCYDLEFVWSIRSETDSLNSDKLMKQFMGGGPEREGGAELYRSGSAEKLVHAGAPPTLIMHGALDELVWCRHSERLATALERVGVPHLFVRLPWATHAGEANLHGPAGQLITGAVLRVARGL